MNFYLVSEAAKTVGLSPRYLRQKIAERQLKATRLSTGLLVISKRELDRFAKARRRKLLGIG